MSKIKVFDDLAELSRFAAGQFLEIGNRAIENKGRFTVALAGGNTPRQLYELLASDEFSKRIDWEKVFFFFGDERDVSPASDQSNFKMANEILFKPLAIQKSNIFRWLTEIIDAAETAQQYEQKIKKIFELNANEFPRFDLILLGLGDDAHTASLFPHTKAVGETERIAVANLVKQLKTTRLTMTFPAINNAANIIFLVSGENKARALQKVLESDFQPEKFPSQNVKPAHGKLLWLSDKAAARFLKE